MTLSPVVANIVRGVAPLVAGALAGPFGPVAAMVVAKTLDAWLGPEERAAASNASPDAVPAVTQAIQRNISDPDFVAAMQRAQDELRRYEIKSKIQFAEIEQKDRDSARVMVKDTGLARPQFIFGMSIVCLALLMLGGIVVGCMMAMAGALTIAPANVSLTVAAFGLLGTVTGAFQGVALQILAFYFGSSKSSADKTAQIGDAMSQLGRDLGDAAKAAPPVLQAPPPAPTPIVVMPPSPTPAPAEPAGPSRFIGLVEKLLDHEGGYVNNPADPGGCTNMGITLATLRDWRHDPGQTCDDVRALTKDQVKSIYFAKYFNALCCGDMPPGVDTELFDFGVNAGVHRAAKMLQGILSKRDPSLKVDGVVGPLTMVAMAKASPRAVIEEFHAAKMDFYRGLGTWESFGKGWTTRAEAVLADALAAASNAA